MPPRHELHSRFHSRRRRGIRARTIVVVLLAATIAGGGAFAVHQIGPKNFARTSAKAIASAHDGIDNLFSSLPTATSQLATAATANVSPLQDLADDLYRAICPFFKRCNNPVADAKPATPLPPTKVFTTSPRATIPIAATSSNSLSGPVTVINNPIKERIIERTIERVVPAPIAGVTTSLLADLEQRLTQKINGITASQSSGPTAYVQSIPFAQSQKIDNLANVTITNPTIVGGSISGTSGVGSGTIPDNATTTTFFSAVGSFTDLIADTFSASVATIGDLTGTRVTFVRSTTTNATTSTLYIDSALTYGSSTGVLTATSGAVSALSNGSNGQVLKMVGGTPSWGTDLQGSVGGSSNWATTSDNLAIYPADPSQVVIVGASATSTSGNILEVAGNALVRGAVTAYSAITAPRFVATSSTASQLPYASTTGITATYASSTAGYFGSLSVGNLSGYLKATAGAVATSLIDLASDVTGTLPVANGGTGSTTLSGILKGNGTTQVATAISGTDYEVPLTFTSPLSRLGNTVSLSTAGDWSGTLGGFTAAQLIALGFSTTSADAWKTTRNFFSTTSADYWETQQSGRSGDDLTNNSIEDLQDVAAITENFGDLIAWNGSAWADLATSSLNISTDNLLEGSSNFFWTNNRFDNRLSATTSVASITTLSNLSLPAAQLTSFGVPFYNFFSATTTDALAQGSTNKYYADSLAQSFIHASSTIPKTYSSNTFTGSNIFSGELTVSGDATLSNATTTSLFVNSAAFNTASFGATATSTFGSTGALSLAGGLTLSGNLNGPLHANNGLVSATTSIGVMYGGTGSNTLTGIVKAAGTSPFSAITTSNGIASELSDETGSGALVFGTSPSLSGLLSFASASGTRASLFDRLYVGDTATTTIFGSATSTFGAGIQSTYLNITGTAATSTFARGIDLAGGCFSINGTCISTGGSSSLTGTTGQLAYFSGTNTAVGTSSLFIATSGNVGIGTTTPFAKLSILRDATYNNDDAAGLSVANATTPAKQLVFGYDSGVDASYIQSSHRGTGAKSLLINPNGGNVGIGTTSPDGKLTVDTGSSARASLTISNSGDALLQSHYVTLSGGSGVGTRKVLSQIQNAVYSTDGSNYGGHLTFLTTPGSGSGTPTERMRIDQGGNVGIGTTNPLTKLQVGATIAAPTALASAVAAGNLLLTESTGSTVGTVMGISQNGSSYDTYFQARNMAAASLAYNLLLQPLGGNVGIGTTAPGTLFSIGNTSGINFTTATTTFNSSGGIDLRGGGCFAVNGTCIGGSDTVEALAAIYATSTAGTTTVSFLGAANSAPSFSAATLTLPSNTSYVVVEVWGAGGGGGAAATNSGAAGQPSCFGTNSIACVSAMLSATGGTGGGPITTAGAGGTGTGGDINLAGQPGDYQENGAPFGGHGGAAPLGGGGGYGRNGGGQGHGPGSAGSSFGGGGGGAAGDTSGAGGGGGGYSREFINAPSGTYYYTVGRKGAGGAAGTYAGGDGGAGGFVIYVYTSQAAGADIAENYPVNSPEVGAGDIVSFDGGMPITVKRAERSEARPLAGVVSTKPGIVLGDEKAIGERPVALAGRVPVKFTDENGAVQIGDRIALSSIPGVGMKASIFDDSVGTVIAPVEHGENGNTVMIFLDLQRGIDINAIALGLLGPDFAFSSFGEDTGASSTTPQGPLDFVGGMMSAFTSRINSFAFFGSVASSTATSSTATSTSPTDAYASGFMQTVFAKIGQWFADAANGIGDFFARRVHTQELCVDDVCVTRDEFLRMKEGQSAAAGAASVLNPAATDDSSASGAPDADTITDTANEAATSTQSVSAPANDNNANQPEAAEPEAEAPDTLLVEEVPEAAASEAGLEASNDNPQPQGVEQSSHDDNSPAPAADAI